MQQLRWGNFTNATASARFTAPLAGEHSIYIELPQLSWCSQGVRVRVGGQVVIDLYKDPYNLPSATMERVTLAAGRHHVIIETYAGDGTHFQPACVWIRHLPSWPNSTYTSNRPASSVDYDLMAGGSIDGSIALYREATGASPLPPKSIFGCMHSTDR